MFERFSENALKVVMLAQEESRRLGHNFVGTEQLLLGLIGLQAGVSKEVFKQSQITLPIARREVENVIGRGGGFVAIEIPFTPRAKKALHLAKDQSSLLRDRFVSDEHILIGVLNQDDCHAVQVLKRLNQSPSRMQSLLLERRGIPEPSSEESIILRLKLARVREEIDPIVQQLRSITTALSTAHSRIKECADDIVLSSKPAEPDVRVAAASISSEFKELKDLLVDDTPAVLTALRDIEEQLRRIHSPV